MYIQSDIDRAVMLIKAGYISIDMLKDVQFKVMVVVTLIDDGFMTIEEIQDATLKQSVQEELDKRVEG